MTKKILMISLVALLFCGQAWADTMIIRPDGDVGMNEWTPTNCVDHYDCVDEETADESDYLSEDAQNATDRWTMQDVSGTIEAGWTIDSVRVTYRAKSSASKEMRVNFRIGSDYTLGTSRNPGSDWGDFTEALAAPGERSWSRENLDSLCIDPQKTGSGGLTYCCHAYVTVFYTTGEAAEGKPGKNIMSGGIIK